MDSPRQLSLDQAIEIAKARECFHEARDIQARELKRVAGRIATTILDFVGTRRRFHASELHEYVAAKCGGAPASADRVLRMLRQSGQCRYRCVDRSASLYEVADV